jgi:hypothetical protein
MAIDISGVYFFMPVFSFLFVFVIVYALLMKTGVLGKNQATNLIVSFVLAIVFLSVSSMELYVKTILPWFVVLVITVFLVLLIAGFATKDAEKMLSNKFAWIVVAILVLIFLISAIHVFNPSFHPDLIITSGGPSIMSQIVDFFSSGGYAGSILLLVIAGAVAWALMKTKW